MRTGIVIFITLTKLSLSSKLNTCTNIIMIQLTVEQNCFVPEDSPPSFTSESPALSFHIHNASHHRKNKLFKARAGTIHLPHGKVRTPVFMPGILLDPILISYIYLIIYSWNKRNNKGIVI